MKAIHDFPPLSSLCEKRFVSTMYAPFALERISAGRPEIGTAYRCAESVNGFSA